MSGGGHNMLQHLTITQMQVPVIGTGNCQAFSHGVIRWLVKKRQYTGMSTCFAPQVELQRVSRFNSGMLHADRVGGSMFTEDDVRRLTWQCRRGMLELDVLFVPFMQEAFRDLAFEDQQRFVKLLDCEDQDLFVWFMQREEPQDEDLKRIIRIMLERVQPA
jgi:antitoxin CptB